MKILLIAPGNSIHSQRLARMLLKEGHEIAFLDSDDPGINNSKNFKFIPHRPIQIRGQRFELIRFLNARVQATQMKLIWLRINPDVVNVHFVDHRAICATLAGINPLVLSCWGSDINNLFEEEIDSEHRKYIALALSSADHITADSREVVDRCKQLAGNGISISYFYFGIDTELFRPGYFSEAHALRQRLSIPSDHKVILSCRRLHPLLGQEYILDAFADIVKDPDIPHTILVFKRYLADGNFEAALKLQAQRLGVLQKVYWLDASPYEESPVHYAMADVVVNYPERDAVPVSLLEAAACKRPIVSSNLAAYQGLWDHAFIPVPPSDAKSLSQALKACLTSQPEEMHECIERAFSLACEVGSERKNVESLGRVFEATISGGEALRVCL